jgi:hypothetical protein
MARRRSENYQSYGGEVELEFDSEVECLTLTETAYLAKYMTMRLAGETMSEFEVDHARKLFQRYTDGKEEFLSLASYKKGEKK